MTTTATTTIDWPDLWFGPVNLWNTPKSAKKEKEVEPYKEVVVYSKAHCPQCVVVKNQLTLKGVEFSEVRIDGDDKSIARWLVEKGHRQVPVVYVDGVHVDPRRITAEGINWRDQ